VWVCFDPQRGGINYAWIGSLDLSPTVAQKINQPAEVEGELFYRDTSTVPRIQFRGYRFVEGGVTLRYDVDGVEVNEHLAALAGSQGFTRRIERQGSVAVTTHARETSEAP
jgi:hypothetical protein